MVSISYIPSGAGHPMFMQHRMEPRWIFPSDAAQSRSCPWKCSPPFDHLSYYRISSQKNNSIPKGHSHENFLLHGSIKARPCRRWNCRYGVGAAHRWLCERDAAEVTLWPGDPYSPAQPKVPNGEQSGTHVPTWDNSEGWVVLSQTQALCSIPWSMRNLPSSIVW